MNMNIPIRASIACPKAIAIPTNPAAWTRNNKIHGYHNWWLHETRTDHAKHSPAALYLTLGAHAQRGLQYLVCVCVCVCVSVTQHLTFYVIIYTTNGTNLSGGWSKILSDLL